MKRKSKLLNVVSIIIIVFSSLEILGTLAGIAMKIYQSYDYIDVLAQANQIDNLDEIYPGQVLDIPPMED